MTQGILPEDRRGNFAGIMQPTVAQSITASDNPEANANADGRTAEFRGTTTALRLFADSNSVYFVLGDSTVVAETTDHYLRENTYMDISVGDYRYLQARRAGTSNVTVHITEME